jgi:hypothetical protein
LSRSSSARSSARRPAAVGCDLGLGSHGVRCQQVGNHLVQHELTVAVAGHRSGDVLQLDLRALHHRQVRLDLRGELARILLPEFLELPFVIEKSTTCVFQLRPKKLTRLVGLDRPVLKALGDELRRQALRDLHRHARIVADETNREISRLSAPIGRNPDRDVLAHQLDDVFRQHRSALIRVEIEILDDPLETRAALNLLA